MVAYTCRFIDYCKGNRNKRTSLSADELLRAENKLIFAVQQQAYPSVEQHFLGNTTSKKTPSIISQLELFQDKYGVIRCKGRLENSPMAEETKFPILLPQQGKLTELIVRKMHRNVLHNGVRETLTELHQKFWIPKGRQQVCYV